MEETGMNAQVALLMGSYSDAKRLEPAMEIFKEFAVPCEVRALSAHRSPQAVADFVREAEGRGIQVIIAAAGGAAHLAGAVAAWTILPVIGIPIGGTELNGLDSLLSTVQMPAGIPVATVAVGGGGPANAALLAIQILARQDPKLADMLRAYRRQMTEKVIERDTVLRKKLAEGTGV